MPNHSCDLFVIGAGSGGVRAARMAAQRGARVVVAEAAALGGTCVNDGCTPTKTLVASASAAWSARHAAEFGVVLKGPVTGVPSQLKLALCHCS